MAPGVGPDPASLLLVLQGPAKALPLFNMMTAQPARTSCLVFIVLSLFPSFAEAASSRALLEDLRETMLRTAGSFASKSSSELSNGQTRRYIDKGLGNSFLTT